MVMRWKWAGLLMLLPGLWLQPVSAESGMYRCVYPDGMVEFRGVPVLGIDCVPVAGSRAPGPRATPEAERETEPTTATPEPADPMEPANVRARNCEIARKNLAVLEGEGPIVSADPDGQPVLMSDEERATVLRQTRRDLEYWCAEP